MAYDGYLSWDGAELVNLSRTAQLAEVLGIDVLWVSPDEVEWIETALTGADYEDITEAPWYDAGYPASAEFAGFVPLSLAGLDDSTMEATVTEYTTDGGNSNKPRNKTLPVVANFAVLASTDRGADFGKRWLDRRLRGAGTKGVCSGAELAYFRYVQREGDPVPPLAHRRDVSITRSTSVTRKRMTDCAAVWWVTFTLTANDPFEYGADIPQFTALGGSVAGPAVLTSGNLALAQTACPVWSYAPIYDPLYPALVAPPSVPTLKPVGWDIEDGDAFQRYWVTLEPTEPSALSLVPVVTLTSTVDARKVRLSIWPSGTSTSDQCDPLFSVIANYLPANQQFVIDGEQQVAYVWDGASPVVRRADSLVYGPDASPVQWTAFNDAGGLLVTLDIFALTGGGYEGGGNVRAAMVLVPKSD